MATENSGKYYYLKLKDDFFDREEIKVLESMPDGFLYSNILMKLYLKSLKNNGRLMLRNVIPYTPQIIASVTGHPVEVVTAAIEIFQQLELIEVLENGSVYMLDVENFVGQSSNEADRVRAYRNRIEQEKRELLRQTPEQNPSSPESNTAKKPVQSEQPSALEPQGIEWQKPDQNGNNPYKCTPEIRDKRIENREYKYIYSGEAEKPEQKPEEVKAPTKSKLPTPPYQEIIDYLNLKTGKNFKATTKETQQHIRARFKEGYNLKDFKRVIDVKVQKWGTDAKMQDYLRPRTLFSAKFESYLNEAPPAQHAQPNSQKSVTDNFAGTNVPEWAQHDRARERQWKETNNNFSEAQLEAYERSQRRYSDIMRVLYLDNQEATAEDERFMESWGEMYEDGRTLSTRQFLDKYENSEFLT